MKFMRVSAGAIGEFVRCPQQYRLRRAGHPYPDTEEVTPMRACGSSLHFALQALYRPGQPFTPPADVPAFLRRFWIRAGYANAREEAHHFSLALDALEQQLYLAARSTSLVLETESFLSWRIAQDELRFELTGRVDRLDRRDDGALEVIDYKAHPGGQVLAPEALAANIVFYCYYVLTRLKYPLSPRTVITQVNLFSGQQTTIEYTPDQRRHHRASLLAAVAGIQAGQSEPQGGAHCAWCPVRDHCPLFNREGTLDDL